LFAPYLLDWQALQHPYFSNAPAPTLPARLPKASVSGGAAAQQQQPLMDLEARAVAIKRKKMMEMDDAGGPLKRVLFS